MRKHHDRRSCPQQLATSEGSGALPVKPEPIDKIRDRELRQQVFKISFFFGAMKIPGIAPRDGNFVYRAGLYAGWELVFRLPITAAD